MRGILLGLTALAAVIGVTACGRGAGNSAAGPAQLPQEVRQAVSDAPKVAQPAAAAPVDVCALMVESDAVSVLGAMSKPPQAKPARGSLLGECDYAGAKGSGSVSAHPADELADTIKSMSKDKATHALSGLGESAWATEYGVMVQPGGKSYFLSIFIVGNDGPAMSEALARKLKL